ncbi:MAG: ribosome maturation factor RimM [Firmicutes bacterium]|nr:ribosome maturation factor RimM [Bacillota bacterium]
MKTILIGKIVNTHGLKGEVKVVATTDFKDERYNPLHPLYLKQGDISVKVHVKKYRVLKGFDLLTFEGLEDINAVEKFKGFDLYSEDFEIKALHPNEFHVDDLLHLQVFQQGILKGTVVQIKGFPQGDYLDVLKLDKTHALIPFRDEFVLVVDLKTKRIEIVEMEGLL